MTVVNILNKDFRIPDGYGALPRPEGVPELQVGYAKQTNTCNALIVMTPISEAEALPMGDVPQVVEGLHQYLMDNQGLIDVKTGATALMAGYCLTVIKTLQEPSGVEYYLVFDVDKGDHVLHVEGYFSEVGVTGQRESIILNNAVQQKVIDMSTMAGWTSDPFDKSFTRGALMNLSEREEYDVHFAGHPLTELRAFIKYIIANN